MNKSDIIPVQPNRRTSIKERNPYLPHEPKKLATLEQKRRFLEILGESEVRGHIVLAAKEFGVGRTTVYARLREDPEFAEAVREVRDHFDQKLLATLEDISEEHAKKPSAVTQRIFLMNALDPARYRPKPVAPAPPAINITFGFQVPRLPGLPGSPTQYKEVESSPGPGSPEDQDKSAETAADVDSRDFDEGLFDAVKDVEF